MRPRPTPMTSCRAHAATPSASAEEAEAYKVQVVNLAHGDADAFTPLLRSYEAAKDVTARRLYMDSVDELLKKSSKVIVDASGRGMSGIVPYLPMSEMTDNGAGPRRAVGSREMSGRGVGVALCLVAVIVLSRRLLDLYRQRGRAGACRAARRAGRRRRRAQGCKFKAPFIDSVYVTSTRSLLLEPPLEQVIMGDREAARSAALRAVSHRRSAALLPGAAHRARRRTRSLLSS